MKTTKNIPISKMKRASKLVQTGAKLGVNYIKYFGDKMVTSQEEAKGRLDESNASDIYDSLKNLKGSALKLAQMLSMEKNILPQAYVEKFSLSQFSVPPLSGPLVVNTFKKSLGKAPSEIYDEFSTEAINAASIGQVHKAKLDGTELAVKIQYPGVADSILSDLAIVKPIAMKMFNIKGKDSEVYFKEVESKLFEETNYLLELEQSEEVVQLCSHIPNLKFPKYYPEFSSKQIITMDWMEGIHLSEFTKQNTNQDLANKLGQTLWDFYLYQIYTLKKVHADPHPGNFLVSKDAELIALDFGCMKELPEDFHTPYFELLRKEVIENEELFKARMIELEILREEDSEEESKFFTELFNDVLRLFTRPFHQENFDFSDPDFFEEISNIGERYLKSSKIRSLNANRGSRHFIYMNRTFFGLFSLMFDLKAKNIKINNFRNLTDPVSV